MRAIKMQAHVEKDHTVSLQLPEDVREGPAEVIVLVPDRPRSLPTRLVISWPGCFAVPAGLAPRKRSTVIWSKSARPGIRDGARLECRVWPIREGGGSGIPPWKGEI